MEVAKAYILEGNPKIVSIDSSIDSNFSSELNLRGIVNIGIGVFQLFMLLMKLFH